MKPEGMRTVETYGNKETETETETGWKLTEIIN